MLDAVESIAEEKGCTAGQVALGWCKDKPGVTSPIVGPRTMEQLEDNLGALGVVLTEEDHQRLDEAAPLVEPLCPTIRPTSDPTASAGKAEERMWRRDLSRAEASLKVLQSVI